MSTEPLGNTPRRTTRRRRTSVDFEHFQDELRKLFAELEVYEQRNVLIREMDKAILRSTFSPQEALDLIVERGLVVTGARHCHVIEYRGNELKVVASSEPDRRGETLPLENSLCGTALLKGEMQRVEDVSKLPPGKYIRFNEDTRSELHILIKPEQSTRILGVLALEYDEVDTVLEEWIEPAELLAGQAAIAIGHARTWSGVNVLYEISTSLLSNIHLEESYQKILDAILNGFDFDKGQILRLAKEDLVILASSRKEDIGLRPGSQNSVCGHYLITEGQRDILVIDDIEEHEYKQFYLPLLQADGKPMRSEMIVPLIENNRLIGALNIESPQVGIFSDLDRKLLGIVGSLMATAVSAALTRTMQANRERSEAAFVAMTQLGNVAQSYLHSFSNKIGDAKGRLFELRASLSDTKLPPLREEKISVVDFVTEIIGTLTQVVTTLSEFTNRFNPDNARFYINEMDLRTIARQALDQVRDRYKSVSTIHFDFKDRMPSVETSGGIDVESGSLCYLSEEIYEVLDNLLNNAIEAILAKGTEGSEGQVIMILDLLDAFHIRLRVQDNGCGIPEEHKDSIFKFGYTSKVKLGPRGIGLWFCKLYIEQRGGSLSYTSLVNVGTTFEIVLPTAMADTLSLSRSV